jgi:hypothetical protein
MKKRKRSLCPNPIYPQKRDDVWYYEEQGGLFFVVDKRTPGTTAMFSISARTLESYLRRRKISREEAV